MPTLMEIHSKFLDNIIDATKLGSQMYSIIPSLFFLIFSFVLLYLHFYKWTNTFTRWKARLYKDIVFHWAYLYISQIWFAFVKTCNWILNYAEWYINQRSTKDEAYWQKLAVFFILFSLALIISMIPCLILTLKSYDRRDIPNFLMWVAEDPWSRSEIGTSGHYLERPPRMEVIYSNQKNSAFRSRRSSSVDTDMILPKNPHFRSCKSVMTVNVPK